MVATSFRIALKPAPVAGFFVTPGGGARVEGADSGAGWLTSGRSAPPAIHQRESAGA